MKKTDRLLLLYYLAAMLIYALHTAVRFGLLAFSGSFSEIAAAVSDHTFRLSDFIAFRSEESLNRLYVLNLSRGFLIFAVLYILGWLLHAAVRQTNADDTDIPAYDAYADDDEYDEYDDDDNYDDYDEYEDDAPAPQMPAPAFRKDDSVKRSRLFKRDAAPAPAASENELDAMFAPQQQDAASFDPFVPQSAAIPRRAEESGNQQHADYFSDLSADADNVRVIVKITQYTEDGEVLVSFFCGDTLRLERFSTASRTANRPVGAGDIKKFIQETRKSDDVFYVYDIRKAAQTPVLLEGEMEDAVRLLDRKIVLRIYRQQMLFITPQYDIRTVESESQAPAAVWAVPGVNNSASRTRSYIKTFYHLDEGISYEVEVRIKL